MLFCAGPTLTTDSPSHFSPRRYAVFFQTYFYHFVEEKSYTTYVKISFEPHMETSKAADELQKLIGFWWKKCLILENVWQIKPGPPHDIGNLNS